jgi:hypothetical protein
MPVPLRTDDNGHSDPAKIAVRILPQTFVTRVSALPTRAGVTMALAAVAARPLDSVFGAARRQHSGGQRHPDPAACRCVVDLVRVEP